VAQVCERWEVSRYKTTTVTSADERCKSLAVGCTSEAPPGAGGIHMEKNHVEKNYIGAHLHSQP